MVGTERWECQNHSSLWRKLSKERQECSCLLECIMLCCLWDPKQEAVVLLKWGLGAGKSTNNFLRWSNFSWTIIDIAAAEVIHLYAVLEGYSKIKPCFCILMQIYVRSTNSTSHLFLHYWHLNKCCCFFFSSQLAHFMMIQSVVWIAGCILGACQSCRIGAEEGCKACW